VLDEYLGDIAFFNRLSDNELKLVAEWIPRQQAEDKDEKRKKLYPYCLNAAKD
jgi:hypothetical protein